MVSLKLAVGLCFGETVITVSACVDLIVDLSEESKQEKNPQTIIMQKQNSLIIFMVNGS
jgi:hypothetical protein